MNKGSIKNYAVWARNELIQRVTQKAYEYGVEKDNIIPANEDSIRGRLLSSDEKRKRTALIREVDYKGYDQLIEEVAYTWFNRFIALRFMEVNNYLPNKVRLFTNENNEFKPQILDEALNVEIAGLEKKRVFELYESNNSEELYKELLLATCNDMHQYLPGMFETIDDYKVLLFPNNLLREESVLGRLISDIDEDSWHDQVQIIGWLYQYYISEKHDKVVDPLHAKAVLKNDVPAATQVFTPDWIVRYMTENSLGRLWLDGHEDKGIKSNWKYYLDEAEQEPDVQKELDKIKAEHVKLKPENIKFLDPCMGSGHILVYAFDMLMQIYVSEGWTEREAAKSILKNNLYGLDIDERAYQLSYFALMMKARQYNRRILSEGITPNVIAIEESNNFKRDLLARFGEESRPLAERVIDIFIDAKEYGSILNVDFTKEELDSLDNKLDEIYKMADYGGLVVQAESYELVETFDVFLKQARIMSQKYDCVVTNPPYLNNVNEKLKRFMNKQYKDFSTDLFASFIKKNISLTNPAGYIGYMTPNVWMFIKSFENARTWIISHADISSLIQLAKGAFFKEATVDICTFVLQNVNLNKYGRYIRLERFKGDMDYQNEKTLDIIRKNDNRYLFKSRGTDFYNIDSFPIVYWANQKLLSIFKNEKPLRELAEARVGLQTGDNNAFIRLWFEIDLSKICFNAKTINEAMKSQKKWFPYNKGGAYRKWFGNNDYVVNWQNDGYEIKHFYGENNRLRSRPQNTQFYFQPSITWAYNTTGAFSARIKDVGFIFDVSGVSMFVENTSIKDRILAFLCSKVAAEITSMLNPTINMQVGDMQRIPIVGKNEYDYKCEALTGNSISLCRLDWDSYEFSWNFTKHPLLRECTTIKEAYTTWNYECDERFEQLKANEEELNRIFIDIYGLQEELTPEVEDKDVTVRKADLQRDIKSLVSYAVGCMFGRYSLDTEGLAYAGGEWDSSKYASFIPDSDNIIPICDDEYFEDDIVHRFVEFIKVAYGENTLEENLQFIAEVLGGTGTPREIIRNYFLNDFFKDHCNTYQVTGSGKRPIYWQFDSGKKNGFKALMYIHRYTPDLIARMRTSYIHELQSKYSSQISMVERQLDSTTTTSERVKVQKRLTKLREQEAELRKYEELVHHWADRMEPMDLDDGVKVNYAKFQELLTKIK